MSEHITIETASKLSGYLEKKSTNFLLGFQKRYITISEGKFILYFEKKGEKPKGLIELEGANITTDHDKKVFKIISGGQEEIFKADSEKERNHWVESLLVLSEGLSSTNHAQGITHKASKRRIEDCSQEAYDAMINSGIDVGNKAEVELSRKCLGIKGIAKHFTHLDPELFDNRIYHSFSQSNFDNKFKKYWLFLISSTPLSNFDLDNDDFFLEPKVLPSFLNFDNLYYFKVDNENDTSPPLGSIQLGAVLGFEKKDDDDEYFIDLDLGNRRYTLKFNIRGLRDKWFEMMVNSRSTHKDINASKTKKPRNLKRLINILESQGIEAVTQVSKTEFAEFEATLPPLDNKNIFEVIIPSINARILPILDAGALIKPPRADIIKIWVEQFNYALIQYVYRFWKEKYMELSSLDLLELAGYLYQYEENLQKFRVKDPNFPLNAREFIKIYSKKSFLSLRGMVENILKIERTNKSSISADGLLVTNGPADLFRLFYTTLDILKEKKMKFLSEQTLEVFKECLMGYILAINSFIEKKELDIDFKSLCAIANNSMEISNMIQDLVNNFQESELVTETEIKNLFSVDSIQFAMKSITEDTIQRLSDEIYEKFASDLKANFFEIDTPKIFAKLFENDGKLSENMNLIVQKKFWMEILNDYSLHYLTSLLTTANKKIKSLDELKKKLDSDYNFLLQEFEERVGKNSIGECLKVIREFINFISSDIDMIGLCCRNIREVSGPSFKISTVKSLIKLRVDLNKEKAEDAIKSCEKILNDYESKLKQNQPVQEDDAIKEMLEQDLALKEKEDTEGINTYEQSVLKFAKKKKKGEKKNVEILGVELEPDEEVKQDLKSIVFKKKHVEEEVVMEILIEGYLDKKANTHYRNKFFQIKNNMIFWYQKKDSKEAKNYIHLKDIKKVIAKKQIKFVIELKEKSYKFKCDNTAIRDRWVSLIENQIKTLNKKSVAVDEIIYTVKLRGREINDYENLPSIHEDKFYFKAKLNQQLIDEDFPLKKKYEPPATEGKKRVSVKEKEKETAKPPQSLDDFLKATTNNQPVTNNNNSPPEKSCFAKFCGCFSKKPSDRKSISENLINNK